MNKIVKTVLKVFLIVALFVGMYGAIMVGAYHYFYKYPKGYLDTVEREAGYRYYEVSYSEYLDENTLLYFARNNYGSGYKIHVGTLYNTKPTILANFFCEEQSSGYGDVNTVYYNKTTTGQVYLFGVCTNNYAVSLELTCKKSEDDFKVYKLKYAHNCFYLFDFDESYANYPCTLVGYLADNDGVALEWNFDSVVNPNASVEVQH